MSRHRKSRHLQEPVPVPPPATHAAPSDATAAPPSVSGNGTAPPGDSTANLVALRAAIEELRCDLNGRLDALAAQVDALLPAHPAHPLSSAHSAAPSSESPLPREAGAASPGSPTIQKTPAANTVAVGDQVYVPRLGGTYTVVEVNPGGRTFKVQTSHVRVRVRTDEAWQIDDEPAHHPPASPPASRPPLSAAIPEVDLHGFSEEDALVTLELFLHHAFAQRSPRVRIIHGKGKGILRAAVRQELARNPMVRGIDVGSHFRGDDGVTLAELDI